MSTDEWMTPPKYIDAARRVMKSIDLDPCSRPDVNKRIGATVFWTKDDDCLKDMSWMTRTGFYCPMNVWMNPPYTREAGTALPYVERLVEEFQNGGIKQAIVLVNASVSTRYFHLAMDAAQAMCLFGPGRIQFLKPDGTVGDSPRYANTFFYFGGFRGRFETVFSQYGKVCFL